MSESVVTDRSLRGIPCVVRYPQTSENIEGRDKIFLAINNMKGTVVGLSGGKADIRIEDGLYEGIDTAYLFSA